MPERLFEIWADDPDEPSCGSLYVVHPQNDQARAIIQPGGILAHSFIAVSSFEASRIFNEWTACGPWLPPVDLADHLFTEEEESEQRDYLRLRKVR